MTLYQGIVVDNDDPNKVGRVKIRIPILHGNGTTGTNVSNEGLPWFEPNVPWYAGYQVGSLMVPPIGAILWCTIEKVVSGQPYFVYLGGSYGVGSKKGHKLGEIDVPAGELETPEEMMDDYPNSTLVCKSLAGSSIFFDSVGTIVLKNEETRITMTSNQINLSADVINLDGAVTFNGVGTDY